jgi:selenocysteine lyase/cysteine desulfurase
LIASSISLRFDDGSMLDARPLAEACHAQGALLCLDVSQCCGAVPIDAAALGADFMTCAGYKWLLSPYGTGFFWARRDHIELLRPGPFYWMAIDGADDFNALRFEDPRPASSARRWDTPEWAGAFNPNLAGMTASAEFVVRVGPATVRAHNARLVDRLLAGLPAGLEVVSPRQSEQRGPFGCFRTATPDGTKALHQRLVFRELGENLDRLRVDSPHQRRHAGRVLQQIGHAAPSAPAGRQLAEVDHPIHEDADLSLLLVERPPPFHPETDGK